MPRVRTLFSLHVRLIVALGASLVAGCDCGNTPSPESTEHDWEAIAVSPGPGFVVAEADDFGVLSLVLTSSGAGGTPLEAQEIASVDCDDLSCEVLSVTSRSGQSEGTFVLHVDNSGSMESALPSEDCEGCPTDPFRRRVEGVRAFGQIALGFGWRGALTYFSDVSYGNEPSPWIGLDTGGLTGFTESASDFDMASERLFSEGCTPLRDTLLEVATEIDREARRVGTPGRALLVVSDGSDSCSTATVEDVTTRLTALGVSPVFVAIGQRGHQRAFRTLSPPTLAAEVVMPTETTIPELRALAANTGGFVALVSAEEAPAKMAQLARTLREGLTVVRVRYRGELPLNREEAHVVLRLKSGGAVPFVFAERPPRNLALDRHLEHARILEEGGEIDYDEDGWIDVRTTVDTTGRVEEYFSEGYAYNRTEHSADGLNVFQQVDENIDEQVDVIRKLERRRPVSTFREEVDSDFDGVFDRRTTRETHHERATVVIIREALQIRPDGSSAYEEIERIETGLSEDCANPIGSVTDTNGGCNGMKGFPEKDGCAVTTGGSRSDDSTPIQILAGDGGGRCDSNQAKKIRDALKKLPGWLECLEKSDPELASKIKKSLKPGEHVWTLACGNSCPNKNGTSLVRKDRPSGDSWTPEAVQTNLNADLVRSDADYRRTLLHEMLHWIGQPHDPEDIHRDQVAACGRYCGGCFDTPEYGGLNADCARCSRGHRKEQCGLRIRRQALPCQAALCHCGLGQISFLPSACQFTVESFCDGSEKSKSGECAAAGSCGGANAACESPTGPDIECESAPPPSDTCRPEKTPGCGLAP